MTAIALALSAPFRLPLLAELLERQRTLAVYGLACLGFAAATLLLQGLDARTLASGISVWAKPTKFFFSVAVFPITAAWFFGYVRPERRRTFAMRASVAMIVVGATFELAYILFQASRGLESHFNSGTPFHALMYTLMGIFAVVLTASTLPLAWEIARRPAAGISRDFAVAVAVGLVLTFLLGAGFGGYMGSQPGHAVGATGGQVPLMGWNRSGGDLRIAHFLGIHAEQAIPLLGAMVAGLRTRTRWALIAAGTLAYTALSLAVFAQAVAGRPLLPL